MKTKRMLCVLLAVLMLLGVTSVAALAADGTARAVAYPARLGGHDVTLNAYEVDGETYLRLRDVASILSDTDEPFNVDWNGSAVSLTTGAAYTSANGTELAAPFSGDQLYTAVGSVLVDGAETWLDAILLTDSKGNGYTYCTRESLIEALGAPAYAIMPLINGEEAFMWYCNALEEAMKARDSEKAWEYLTEAEKYNFDDETLSMDAITLEWFDEANMIIKVDLETDETYVAKFHIDGTFEAYRYNETNLISGTYYYEPGCELYLTGIPTLEGAAFELGEINEAPMFVVHDSGYELFDDLGKSFDEVSAGGEYSPEWWYYVGG